MFRLCSALLLAGTVVLVGVDPTMAQQRKRISPHETVSTMLKDGLLTIVYGRPYSKDPKTGEIRKIWGGLVPFGKPWRAGSDEATIFCVGQSITLGDKAIPAGGYTLYMIPEENGPTKLVVSKYIGQRPLPIKRDNDLAEIEMKKEELDNPVDQFTIDIQKTKTGGVLKFSWEKTQFSVPFTVEK